MINTKQNNQLKNKLIVITRPELDNLLFKQQLEQYSAQVYLFPTIKIVDVQNADTMHDITKYNWIIFTSANGVDFFMSTLKRLRIDQEILKNKKIAVVGPKTAEKAKEYDLSVDFIPSKYTTDQLVKELINIKNQKILLPRSDIGSKKLVQDLKDKGARVTDMPIYKTQFIDTHDCIFKKLLETQNIDYITFTSPSTVEGFFSRLKKAKQNKVFSIPILSVGPVTTRVAKKYGFQNIITADTYTTNGMIKKLLEIV